MKIRQALNRVTYGVLQEDIEAVKNITWQKWVQKQLLLENSDKRCDQLIKDITYSLSYKEQGKVKQKKLSLFRY
ncbi:MAG TPA: hypothetical protein ENJ82_03105, partial [Bacteroidetes bacterium]|nr:hypothetical protein [Bacteroidota bacterium]